MCWSVCIFLSGVHCYGSVIGYMSNIWSVCVYFFYSASTVIVIVGDV